MMFSQKIRITDYLNNLLQLDWGKHIETDASEIGILGYLYVLQEHLSMCCLVMLGSGILCCGLWYTHRIDSRSGGVVDGDSFRTKVAPLYGHPSGKPVF